MPMCIPGTHTTTTSNATTGTALTTEGSSLSTTFTFLPQSAGFNNAFYDSYDNSMNYGDGDGIESTFNSAALDIVAHEITHGVTNHSSDLIYRNESGGAQRGDIRHHGSGHGILLSACRGRETAS